jgi:hypothetical protein
MKILGFAFEFTLFLVGIAVILLAMGTIVYPIFQQVQFLLSR